MTARHSDCVHCLMRGQSIFAGLSREEVCELGMDVQDIHVP
ncbi:Crp/Fnr family transcriptional regulator, partial [Acidithiobacillus ferrooxidans]|nr:Crp/Fnr family transcriptional regulator [Acidithiobacillus ferrooxidans]